MITETREIGPVKIFFDEGLPDEIGLTITATDVGDFKSVEVFTSLSTIEVRRIVASLQSLLENYLEDTTYGERFPRHTEFKGERI